MIGGFLLVYIPCLMIWGLFLGGYSDFCDDEHATRNTARMALLTPIYPLVLTAAILYGIAIGLRELFKVAEIGSKPRPKSDPVKIQLMEAQNELEDTKRELELVQEQFQKLVGKTKKSKYHIGW